MPRRLINAAHELLALQDVKQDHDDAVINQLAVMTRIITLTTLKERQFERQVAREPLEAEAKKGVAPGRPTSG